MKVIIYDESKDLLSEISGVCNSLGFTVVPASDYALALAGTAMNSLDFALLEVSNDTAKALKYISTVKGHPKLAHLPVIVYSRKNSRDDLAQCLKNGARGFLVCPITGEKLKKAVAQFVEGVKAEPKKPEPVREEKPKFNVTSKEARAVEIESKISKLPSFPYVVTEVLNVARNEKSSAVDFQKVIEKDQALTAKLLKMSNSSFYMQSRPITTIQDAVVILGIKSLKSLVYAITTSDIFTRELPGYGYEKSGLWKHSMIVASTSRNIARRKKLSPTEWEEAFVAGLLHDLGKLVVSDYLRNVTPEEQATFTELDILDVEKQYCGFDHTEVGYQIAEAWRLPSKVKASIQNHHHPLFAESEVEIINIVHLADYLATKAKIGFKDEPVFHEHIDEQVLEKLGFNEKDLEALEEQLMESAKDLDTIANAI